MDDEKSIDALLDEEIMMWDPQPNEKLVGKYKGKRTGFGKFNSTVYLIKKADVVFGVWGSAVIDDKLRDCPVDTPVGIKFMGMAQSEKGSTYRNYRVIIIKDEPAQ